VNPKNGSTHQTPATAFPPQVVNWFVKMFQPLYNSPTGTLLVQIFTEIKLRDHESGESMIIRAHPNYRGEGCWYDHVNIDYGEGTGVHPARVAVFFSWPKGIPSNEEITGLPDVNAGDLMMLVQQARNQTEEQQMDPSIMFSHYTLEHKVTQRVTTNPITGMPQGSLKEAVLALQSAWSINDRILVINPTPDDGGPFFREDSNFEILVVADRKWNWPNAFLESAALWWD
jgi:hypothetical protein